MIFGTDQILVTIHSDDFQYPKMELTALYFADIVQGLLILVVVYAEHVYRPASKH